MPSLLAQEFDRIGHLAPPFDIFRDQADSQDRKYVQWLLKSHRAKEELLPERLGRSQEAQVPVALLGDAAHTMPEFLGEGGCHAMIDALQLGRSIVAAADDQSLKCVPGDYYRAPFKDWDAALATWESDWKLLQGSESDKVLVWEPRAPGARKPSNLGLIPRKAAPGPDSSRLVSRLRLPDPSSVQGLVPTLRISYRRSNFIHKRLTTVRQSRYQQAKWRTQHRNRDPNAKKWREVESSSDEQE
ncbi:hypothetical protein MMC13_007555 [Lambiella insularis]|nr:hypothetical protein [Lambiella insularis]